MSTAIVERSRAAILLAGGLVGLALLCGAAKLFLNAGWAWRCPMLSVLHLPCPSCGSTRALAALSEFRVIEAVAFNPLLVSLTFVAPLLVVFRSRLADFSRTGWRILVAAVLLNWIYLYFFLPR